MSYPIYPEYKVSGVEWLGEVPTHWMLGSFRHLIKSLSNGTTANQVDQEENSIAVSRIETISKGKVDFSKVGYVRLNELDERFLLRSGDVLFSHINSLPMIGNAAVYEGDKPLLHGMNLLRIQPAASVDSSWVLYWLKSKNIRQEVESRAKPAINQASISTASVKSLPALIPPQVEQRNITSFLDHETARIDALVEEQQRLIALLKEKRQAVISHAVTKGLDPDVPMKDSGVEWLGEVPAHWTVGPLRWYATIQGGIAKGKSYNAETPTVELPYLRVANVQDGYVDLSTVKTVEVAVSEVGRYRLQSGDVLMNEGGDNDKLGRGTVWKGEITDCLHQNHVFAIRPNQYLLPRWLSMFTRSNAARAYFYLYSKQSTNLASISSSSVMSCPLPLPPVEEQREVLDFLAIEAVRLDDLMQEGIKAINLLQERRSALISAAVTGKIDVRGWQPPEDSAVATEEITQMEVV
ncbi:restriction endonuclease subunit S [Halovibrio variabilis]|uniref:restriction endonuclease subunit S n=1 Tax=Halovibrio variabilis TaxID=31910 RepID=UPI0011BEC98C|nr:restriction endonuclease subunit S [Halovibrio variabilis]